ncbi:MAG: 16S rRNA (guanine(527)-N(7))-methyltransferase RsmG [Bacteroidota bacterium]|nr:MAG: 16S rRNA (guanine(527)-N(7))-methyltransferase RsmG [Bacteroidota bacterium]
MEEILRYFPGLSAHQKQQFAQLSDLYHFWNAQINLVSRKDIDQLYVRHVLHSLAIAKHIQFLPVSKIMDVGTGGGFPGIPLAIMFPQSNFLLIDSIAKKIKVVNDIIEKIGLNNCAAKVIRAEEVNQKFDFIVSRAVTNMPDFYSWVRKNISSDWKHEVPNGILYLKGGNLEEELMSFAERYVAIDLSEYFTDPFFETKKLIHLFEKRS